MTDGSECEQLLKEILNTLNELRAILTLANQDKLEETKNVYCQKVLSRKEYTNFATG
jgi:hypothetical protein